jgi:hypothetical protein
MGRSRPKTQRNPNPILMSFKWPWQSLKASTRRKSLLSATHPTMPKLPSRSVYGQSVSGAAALTKQNCGTRFMMALLTYLSGAIGPCSSSRSLTEAVKRRAEVRSRLGRS